MKYPLIILSTIIVITTTACVQQNKSNKTQTDENVKYEITTEEDTQTLALIRCLAGTYTDENGKNYVFSADAPRASGFGGAEQYTVDFDCYIPNFSIRFEDGKAYRIVGEWYENNENGVNLRFEPYDKNDENSENECYPEETAQSIKLTKIKWDSNVADKTINGRYPYTSTRAMTVDELMVFIIDNLDVMRNEIFARHGHIFKSDRFNDYFNAQS